MEEQIITFETAKLAKEKGFEDTLLVSAYSLNGFIYRNKNPYSKVEKIKHKNPKQCFNRDVVPREDVLVAPTQSLLQKWLREKHNVYVYCIPRGFEKGNGRKIIRWANNFGVRENKFSSTYEKALEKGLFEALKLI